MSRIDKVHLHVTRYSRARQELWLDFIKEDEFLYFKYRDDYTADMRLSTQGYEPTMLLIHECAPKKPLRPGSILIFDMDGFMKITNERDSNDDCPATVFLEIKDGKDLAELIDKS